MCCATVHDVGYMFMVVFGGLGSQWEYFVLVILLNLIGKFINSLSFLTINIFVTVDYF